MRRASAPSELSAQLLRAARGLLGWSQKELATAAGVATSTVADFERGARAPMAVKVRAIRAALEKAGVRFRTAGVELGSSPSSEPARVQPVVPVDWISAQDLEDWANRTDCPDQLPALIERLILATSGASTRLRFPREESTSQAGWDGWSQSADESKFVDAGVMGWELSAQKRNLAKKASDDYEKRTRVPGPVDPRDATFVFVTPRRWATKDAWAGERQAEGRWKRVKVYDADDLVLWLGLAPAVSSWLAERLGKRPPGTRELDELWQEWSRAAVPPLTEELVLADREEDVAELLRWVRADPSVLSLRGTTTDEVAAFVRAALGTLSQEDGLALRARTLIATTKEAARELAAGSKSKPLLLLLTDADPGLAQSAVERGHHVLLAYDDRVETSNQARMLARPTREKLAAALTHAGVDEPKAARLARDSARNLVVLRRLMAVAPDEPPAWASEPPRSLLAALLAGGWDESFSADRERLSELADQPYERVVEELTPLLSQLDSPVQKIGSTWRIASPYDAWHRLAHRLSSVQLDRFERVSAAVLGAPDPRFELRPEQRWLSELHGVRRANSTWLRHGLGQSLILLAVYPGPVRGVPDAKSRVDSVVTGVFRDADRQRWWSLSRDFRLLAEASPQKFLDAIDASLDREDPPIRALFSPDGGGVFGAEHLSDLMWALESLAWSPTWLLRVTQVLARLDAIDVEKRVYQNGPLESLRTIHRLRRPQTYATLKDRLRALDSIRDESRFGTAAWKLLLRLLPQGMEAATRSATPRWRDFSADATEELSWPLVGRSIDEVSSRLVGDAGLSAKRWSNLLDRLGDLSPGPEAALDALESAEPKITDAAERSELWHKLRRVLHRHRKYAHTKWSLRKPVLERLSAAYERFGPADPIDRVAWLFGTGVELPNPAGEGWEADVRELDLVCQRAVAEIYDQGGIDAVLSLAKRSEHPVYVGTAIHRCKLPSAGLDALIEAAARSEDDRARELARGLIRATFHERKVAWAEGLVARAKAQSWGDSALLAIFLALPLDRWTWDLVADVGGEVEASYWRTVPAFGMPDDSDVVAHAIQNLSAVGRAREALGLANRRDEVHLSSDLLVSLLREASKPPQVDTRDSNDATMLQYHVAEIMKALDERADVEPTALLQLEWIYLRVLEDSRRPPKVLLRALSEQPEVFDWLLRALYRSSEEEERSEPEGDPPESHPAAPAKLVAEQAFRLLWQWNRIPGTQDDGRIDGEALNRWLEKARSLAQTARRLDHADRHIGEVFSTSPLGADGHWPAEPVREALERVGSKEILEGLYFGTVNRHGQPHTLRPVNSVLDREEASKYRTWAKALESDHPRTARVLIEIAESCERDAQRHDDDSERRAWVE